ncbi:hypothetical protein [Vibrio diabolicus]|uniref:hypothetical protein n=1 Tax=Vibrio diabolicus TaxID=50719 RepID=UPI0015F698E5|nr:hypothetical protein [Vibrio diabolicus]
MAFNELIGQLGAVIAVVVNLAVLSVSYNKINSFRGEQAKELHSRFTVVKELSKDIDANYAELLIILSGLTRASLSKDEIHWFITEPRAFLKLEAYGKLCGRYCQIDLEKREFSLTEKVNTVKKRVIERIKIVTFCVLIMSTITTIWYFVVSGFESVKAVYLALGFWCAYLLLILWGAQMLLSALSKAKELSGKP